jgi:hypothetical protein
MGRAKKFEISQGSYELFFIMCIYDEKKQYRVTKKIKRFYVLSQICYTMVHLYNGQLYSLIVCSKVALFSPWPKKHSQLKA